MNSRTVRLGASFAGVILCALWLASASGAKAKYPATYSGSFSMTSRAQSPADLDYTTVDVTGVRLKHYATKLVLHQRIPLYKFTAGHVKWHQEYNVDGCAYTLDREYELTALTSTPPGQPPLFFTHLSYLKRGTYKMGGNFPVKITDPVTETCTTPEAGTFQQQITPGIPPLSPWTGKTTKLPSLKGHFTVDGSEGDEVDHAAFEWDLVGE